MPRKHQPANAKQREFGAEGLPPLVKKKAGSTTPAHDGSAEGILKAVIADSLGVDAEEIEPDTDLRAQLGAESLDIHQLVLDVEEQLDVTIPEELDLDRLQTFKDWLAAVGNPKELRRVAREKVSHELDDVGSLEDFDPKLAGRFAQEESEL